MEKLVCSKCSGSKIQIKAWVDANTYEVIDVMTEDQEDTWCEDCQEHNGVTSIDTDHIQTS